MAFKHNYGFFLPFQDRILDLPQRLERFPNARTGDVNVFRVDVERDGLERKYPLQEDLTVLSEQMYPIRTPEAVFEAKVEEEQGWCRPAQWKSCQLSQGVL